MTTFQAIIYAMIEGMSEFLPISSKTHHILVPYLIGWQPPTGIFIGALSLGTFLSIFVYFRHDWASMISSLLQVIIFRKRPMTMDERLPLLLGLTSIPLALASYYFQDQQLESLWSPLWVSGFFAAMGIPLWFFDSMSRRSKGMYDWTWRDAIFVGITQATALIPGWDHLSGLLIGALFLNYRREHAVKYAYFASGPILFVRALSGLKGINFHAATPMTDLSWLSFGTTILVAFLAGLLVIGGFMKHVQQKGLGQYVFYRWILAAGVFGLYWMRNHP